MNSSDPANNDSPGGGITPTLASVPPVPDQLPVTLQQTGEKRRQDSDSWRTRPPGSSEFLPADGDEVTLAPVHDTFLQVPGYEILEKLGEGGMGVVYRARQVGLNRVVALKMIRLAQAGSTYHDRFRSEAEAVARLQHPNIVQVYEVGEHQGLPYFSLEYCAGGSLTSRLKGQPLLPADAARLLKTLAGAVHAVHQHRVIHRDLKPDNVLLTAAPKAEAPQRGEPLEVESWGPPKVADFGLARLVDATVQTAEGAILGTPSYMAPEQALGKVREMGPGTDVYALGAILYELLTGRPPFKGATWMETIWQVIGEEVVPPRQLQPRTPRDLETICLHCLRKEARHRYGSARALEEDLERFLNGEAPRVRPSGTGEKLLSWARRHPTRAALGGAASSALVGLAGLAGWHQVDLQNRLAEKTREVREAEQEKHERELRESLGREARDLLFKGQSAEADRDWPQAAQFYQSALDKTGEEPLLEDLRAEARERHDLAVRGVGERQRLRNFREGLNNALFHLARFTGRDPAEDLREVRAAVEGTLRVLGVKGDNGLDLDERYFTPAEMEELREGCFELLLLLAEAAAPPGPGPDPGRADLALGALDRAARLGLETQALPLRRARFLARGGRAEEARRAEQDAGKIRPALAVDFFLLGEDAFRDGQPDRAIREFGSALRVRPDHLWARYFQAICFLREGRPGEARVALDACVGRDSDTAWTYLLRGHAHDLLGDFGLAEEDFGAALRRNPDGWARYAVLVNRGMMFYRKKDLERAITDWKEAAGLKPDQYQPYLNLALAYESRGELGESVKRLTWAIALRGDLGKLYRSRARVHLQVRDRARTPAAREAAATAALADLEKGLQRPGDSRPAERAADHLDRARIFRERGQWPEALQACADALGVREAKAPAADLDALHAEAQLLRGEVLFVREDWPGVVEALDECVRLGKRSPGAYRLRGLAHARLPEGLPGALADFTLALDLLPDPDPARVELYVARGWAYAKVQALNLAELDFQSAILRDPNRADAYNGRGFVRVSRSETELARAAEDARKALGFPSKDPVVAYNAARVLALASARARASGKDQADQYQDEAVRALEQALLRLPPEKRKAFWQSRPQEDPELRHIGRSQKFKELEKRYGEPRP